MVRSRPARPPSRPTRPVPPARPPAPARARTAAAAVSEKGSGWKRSARTAAQVDVHIAIVQAATEFERGFVELLKPEELSPAQYNVLRILRGAGDAGLTCSGVGDRLIRHDPDVTRLLDRLDHRHLIERSREPQDRRVVRTRITAEGLAVLARLDPELDALHERQLGHVSPERLAQLTALIQEARARVR